MTYQGVRVSALWEINDDWNALITQSYQTMDAEGVFYQMPFSSDGEPLPEQSVTLFNPSFNKDRFENTAWTINGRVGALNVVYTGSYLVRNVEASRTTPTTRAACTRTTTSATAPSRRTACRRRPASRPAPPGTRRSATRTRATSCASARPMTGACAASSALFWEKLRLYDQLNWLYKTLPACTATVQVGCFTEVGPEPGSSVNNPEPIRGDNVAFFNDVKRGYKQRAFFTSVDFDIIPKVLTITAGTRYYHFDNDERGAVAGSFGCYEAGPGALPGRCDQHRRRKSQDHLQGLQEPRESDLAHPAGCAGLLHLVAGLPAGRLQPQRCLLHSGRRRYAPVLLAAGLRLRQSDQQRARLKTEFFEHRLQLNGAVYQEDWKNVQVSFFDPGVLGNVGFGTNGPTYRIRGIETSFIAVLAQGLTAQGSAAWNSSKQTNSPFLIANNPALPADELGKPIPRSSTRTVLRAVRPRMRRRCSSTCACATSGS